MTRPVLILSLAVGLAGCGKMKDAAESNRAANAVKALSIDYKTFQDMNGHPPKSADELTGYVKNLGNAALRPGELDTLTVQWGAKFDPAMGGAGGKVLASARPVGGQVQVLMQDGAVKAMTEDELAKAPKAEPASKP